MFFCYLFSATMAIHNVVQLVQADVSTIALAIAVTTASTILAAGTKRKHFGIDLEIRVKEVMHNKSSATSIIAGCSRRSFDQVDRDRYTSPIEAIENGLIDGDSIIPLEPVPDKVKTRVNYEEISKDPMKFLTLEIQMIEILRSYFLCVSLTLIQICYEG